jgi:hypothetical protein
MIDSNTPTAQCADTPASTHVSPAAFNVVVVGLDELTNRVAELGDIVISLKLELDRLKAT